MQVEHLEFHAEAETDHWWFAARREIVLTLLQPALPAVEARPLRILDVGCGAGGMLSALARFGDVAGVDASPLAVDMAIARSGADVRLGALPDALPFDRAEFDAITLLDVLEHVDDDARALSTLSTLLRPGGLLVITVPAYRFLWSEHDVVNEHRRRYTRSELGSRLRGAGFVIDRLSYFNTFLFPPIAAARLAGRIAGGREGADHGRVAPAVNGLLRSIFAAERRVLRHGSFPFGVSIIALARTPAGAANGGGHHDA